MIASLEYSPLACSEKTDDRLANSLIESIAQVVPVPRLPDEGCGHKELNETPERQAADAKRGPWNGNLKHRMQNRHRRRLVDG